MTADERDAQVAWAQAWLAQVADGSLTMSQRKLSSLEAHGGVDVARKVAERLGVHLAVLIDDRGEELVAASAHPIRVIC
ncbi:MAG: hypothetical protein M3R65_08385 [Gemmatimonadota bacterium]|nr:hypothetical protein [Gemmatimonadota bacterium]